MTAPLLELFIGAAMIYAGVKCRAFVPLLAGRDNPGTHCTGSLLTVVGAIIADKLLGSFITDITAAIAGAIAGKASAGRRKVLPNPTPTPTPSPTPLPPTGGPKPLPAPEPPQLPGPGELAASQPGQPQSGYQVLQAVPISAQTFTSLTGLAA